MSKTDVKPIKKKEVNLECACDFREPLTKGLPLSTYAAIFLWLGWFSVIPIAAVVTITCFVRGYVFIFSSIVGLLLIASLLPINLKLQPNWGFEIGSWCMKNAVRYFGLRLFFEDRSAVENSGPAIFLIEPHDVMPVTLVAYSDCLGFNKGHKNIGCLSGACFQVPFMRHIYTWAMASSVDKKNVLRLMDEGYSPTICPGGAQEVAYLDNDKDECVLFLTSRFGVIKLAMEKGRPLIPSFAFNQRGMWDFWLPKSGLMHWLGRKIGFMPIVFFGLFGIPLFIPKPWPVVLVVGKPISVPRTSNPSQEELLKFQKVVLESYRTLFEDHKAKFGMAKTDLRII